MLAVIKFSVGSVGLVVPAPTEVPSLVHAKVNGPIGLSSSVTLAVNVPSILPGTNVVVIVTCGAAKKRTS